ncbi:hypothetical protein RZS08_39210, partial [Arthrospira platensis SPKY1]|nr:hypothetical protein [Arthrospira platensis SPKY1]
MTLKSFHLALLGGALGLALTLTACGGSDREAPEPRFAEIELNIAHINDHHSQLEPFRNQVLTIDGVPTRVEIGGFARVTTAFAALEGRHNLLKLHAGDAITGTLYHTLFRGEADAALMNTV